MLGVDQQIEAEGFAHVPYALNEQMRAEFTLLGNDVISLAVEDQRVADMLSFDALVDLPSHVRQASYGVSGPVNSADDKLTLHVGYQSRSQAHEKVPERNQPQEVRRLWEVLPAMLDATEATATRALEAVGEPGLVELVFPADKMLRNVLLRVARYIGARSKPVGMEVFSGHIDLGILSLHPFESHGNWFQAAPVPASLVIDENTQERRQAFREIREQLKPIAFNHEREAAVFMGASYVQLADREIPLPVCYHAGFRPTSIEEVVSPHMHGLKENDRLVHVAFLSPSLNVLRDPSFTTPSVAACRPAWG